MTEKFELEWLQLLSKGQATKLLLEYRYFVKRFVPWVALIIARTDDIRIRQLLLPNLIDECGEKEEESHVRMLDKLIESTGFSGNPELYKPLVTTKQTAKWFYEVFNGYDVYKSLCVMGPATENISAHFLQPLKTAIIKIFNGQKIDATYFDVHLSETEREHAQSCVIALQIMENEDKALLQKKEKTIAEGIEKHQFFWEHMKLNLIGF